MENLTTHDLIWMNEQLTGRVQPFNYVTLEACMAGQYAYEESTDVPLLAATLMERLLAKTPFLEGNRRTAYMATVVFLEANGYAVNIGDSQAAQLVTSVAEGRLSPVQAIGQMAAPANNSQPMGLTIRKMLTHECNEHAEALRLLTPGDSMTTLVPQGR